VSEKTVFLRYKLTEKRREFNLPTYLAFLNYEKTFDKGNRSLLLEILLENGLPRHFITDLQCPYWNNVVKIRATKVGKMTAKSTEVCNMGVQLHLFIQTLI